MKNKTLAWAVKYPCGSFKADTIWRRSDAKQIASNAYGRKVVRVEIKEVKKK